MIVKAQDAGQCPLDSGAEFVSKSLHQAHTLQSCMACHLDMSRKAEVETLETVRLHLLEDLDSLKNEGGSAQSEKFFKVKNESLFVYLRENHIVLWRSEKIHNIS